MFLWFVLPSEVEPIKKWLCGFFYYSDVTDNLNICPLIVDIILSNSSCVNNGCLVLSSGVEHLLRDVKDTTISTLATEVIFHDCFFPFACCFT